MYKKLLIVLLSVLLAAVVLRAPLFARRIAADEEIDIVVSKSNNLAELSLEDARKIFMCDKSAWQNGKHISVLMLVPGQPERTAVVRSIYKMNENDYAKYFLQAAFTGRIPAPPRELGSAQQMKQSLAQNPWAIGYLRKQDVDDSVKVILRLQ